MTYTTYVDGDGLKKNRKVRGTGTTTDPFESYVYDVDLNTAVGARTDAVATTDTGTFGVIAGLKRLLSRFTSLYTDFGTQTDEADAAGTLMAKLTDIAVNIASIASPVRSSAVNVSAVTITTSATTVTEIVTADWDFLTVWIQNTGSVALNEFKTEAGVSASLAFKYSYLAGSASSTSYSTGTGKQSGNALIPVINANNLPALAASGDAFIELDVRRYQRIRFQASVASGTTTVVLNGILTR